MREEIVEELEKYKAYYGSDFCKKCLNKRLTKSDVIEFAESKRTKCIELKSGYQKLLIRVLNLKNDYEDGISFLNNSNDQIDWFIYSVRYGIDFDSSWMESDCTEKFNQEIKRIELNILEMNKGILKYESIINSVTDDFNQENLLIELIRR